MNKYKKIKGKLIKTISFMLALSLLFTNTSYARNELTINQESVNTECSADLVMDMDTGEILFSHNIHDKLYPASITKLLTGLLATEYGDLNDTITFNQDAVNLEDGSSNLGFIAGEKVTLKNLLYGLMIKSANEGANQLAYYIEEKSGMSYKDAASKKLAEIGAFDTVFTSPSGLHKDNHYTTAYDMALIAKAAYENETFREFFTTATYTIPRTNKSEERFCSNTHKMMFESSPYYFDGVLGGKTGHTSQAGYTLVTFYEKDGLRLLVVTLDGETYFNDTYRLLKYFKNNYSSQTLFKKGENFISLPVCDDSGVVIDHLELQLAEDLKLSVPNDWADKTTLDLLKKKINDKIILEESNHEIELEQTEDTENDENENEENDEEESNDDDTTSIDQDNIEVTDELLTEYNITQKDINMTIFDYENDLFEIELNLPENITSTVLENDVVGNINIKFNNGIEKNISVISKQAYDLTDSIDFTILYIILFITAAIILIIYSKKMIELSKEEKDIKNGNKKI